MNFGGGRHSGHSRYYSRIVRYCFFLCTVAQPQTLQGNKHFLMLRERAAAFQEWVRCVLTGLPTPPQGKASIAPFIIEIDFSPTCITKIYPSYFELRMCHSTKITISIQQQGQSKVLMLRNVNCFMLISVRIKNGSAVCVNPPPTFGLFLHVIQEEA